MCGIAGFLADRPDLATLKSMCRQLEHRGPDGNGVWLSDEAALGHRRLSIIDVAGGAQPLANETGSVLIVFNGEIYNYRDLRRQLIGKGHRFSTDSDTEVIVHLYEEEGEDAPAFLQGMFAFALWDASRHELFLARDRLGEKPLYYTYSVPDYRFCFASEVKALTVVPGFESRVDVTALADYLALSYVPDPKSIYVGVNKLPPAHSLTVGRGGVRLRRYWQCPFPSIKRRSFDESAGELQTLAKDAVQRQMMSEVPIGAFLSGGLDSSSIAALAAEGSTEPVRTFSIGFSSDRFNELPFARMAAERHHTHHRERVVTASMREMLPVLIRHHDEPFADSSAIPMLYLSKLAREWVTVALSGDGADEVFAGYRHQARAVTEERIRGLFSGPISRRLLGLASGWSPQSFPGGIRPRAFVENIAATPADAYFNAMAAFSDEGLLRVLAPEIRAQLQGYSPRDRFREKFRACADLPILEQFQSVDMETYLAGDILVKVDRTSMAYSLESRAPWLDHRIVEFAGSLPPDFKLRGRNRKRILRAAMSPYLPEAIVSRRKQGFEVPLAEWLEPAYEQRSNRPSSAPMRNDSSTCEPFACSGRNTRPGKRIFGRKLWSILVLAMWSTHWLDHQSVQS